MTERSSSVVVSPFTSPPAAISFSSRRMILPLRVLGRESLKRTSSGFASDPISFATHCRNSSFNSGLGAVARLQRDERRDGLALQIVEPCHHRGFGHLGCATSADSTSMVLRRCPDTLITSSMRPMIQK